VLRDPLGRTDRTGSDSVPLYRAGSPDVSDRHRSPRRISRFIPFRTGSWANSVCRTPGGSHANANRSPPCLCGAACQGDAAGVGCNRAADATRAREGLIGCPSLNEVLNDSVTAPRVVETRTAALLSRPVKNGVLLIERGTGSDKSIRCSLEASRCRVEGFNHLFGFLCLSALLARPGRWRRPVGTLSGPAPTFSLTSGLRLPQLQPVVTATGGGPRWPPGFMAPRGAQPTSSTISNGIRCSRSSSACRRPPWRCASVRSADHSVAVRNATRCPARPGSGARR
jgi:hypothetical protein